MFTLSSLGIVYVDQPVIIYVLIILCIVYESKSEYNLLYNLNLNKTCCTIFGKQLDRAVVPLLLQDKHIEPVYSAKYLGIYLVCKLSWSEHIKELCIKLSGVFHHIAFFVMI